MHVQIKLQGCVQLILLQYLKLQSYEVALFCTSISVYYVHTSYIAHREELNAAKHRGTITSLEEKINTLQDQAKADNAERSKTLQDLATERRKPERIWARARARAFCRLNH